MDSVFVDIFTAGKRNAGSKVFIRVSKKLHKSPRVLLGNADQHLDQFHWTIMCMQQVHSCQITWNVMTLTLTQIRLFGQN
jgi:hypothetical protein